MTPARMLPCFSHWQYTADEGLVLIDESKQTERSDEREMEELEQDGRGWNWTDDENGRMKDKRIRDERARGDLLSVAAVFHRHLLHHHHGEMVMETAVLGTRTFQPHRQDPHLSP